MSRVCVQAAPNRSRLRSMKALIRFCSAAVIGIAVATAPCGASGDRLGSQIGPSPIVLADTSPAQLSVAVLLNSGGYTDESRSKTLLDISFQHGGRPVQFVKGEKVACDGVELT